MKIVVLRKTDEVMSEITEEPSREEIEEVLKVFKERKALCKNGL